METLILRPSEIRYSQDSIECWFSNGTPLTCVFAHLISGSLKVSDLPRIEVMTMNGQWWTVTGNRRLVLYRKLQEVGVIKTSRVTKRWISPTSDLFKRKFANVCNGQKISSGQTFLTSCLNEIVSEWKKGQDVVAKWDKFKRALAVQYGYREDSDNDDYEECQSDYEYDQSEYGFNDYDDDDDYNCGEQNDCDDPEGQDDYYQDANEDQDQDAHYDECDNADTYNDHLDAYNDNINACNDHNDAQNDLVNAHNVHTDACNDNTDAYNDQIDAYYDQIDAKNDHIDACNDHTDAYEDHIDAYNDQIDIYYDPIDAQNDHPYADDHIDAHDDQMDEYSDQIDAYNAEIDAQQDAYYYLIEALLDDMYEYDDYMDADYDSDFNPNDSDFDPDDYGDRHDHRRSQELRR